LAGLFTTLYALPAATSAYVAQVLPGKNTLLIEACDSLDLPKQSSRVGLYMREIGDHSFLFILIEGTETVPPSWKTTLSPFLKPLPNAQRRRLMFEPMEQIFFESGAEIAQSSKEPARIAMFTGLKRDKEAHYRLLHDNPWPDVLAAIQKANFKNFSIFLEKIDGNIYLFGWLEHIGDDFAADSALNQQDPASIRWWAETDACQIAPPEVKKGLWGGLQEIAFVDTDGGSQPSLRDPHSSATTESVPSPQ